LPPKIIKMKRIKYLLLNSLTFLLLLSGIEKTEAQVSTIADTSKMTYNQFSKMSGVYVYPSQQQSVQQQKKDEYECYKWAALQSGYDPVNPAEVKVDTIKNGSKGTVAKKTIAGTAFGSIGGEAGRGAAIGAISGIRQKKMMEAKQQQQAKQEVQARQDALISNYRKAFSACMEGKGYTVK
jgi:hypothetical protein